MAQSVSAPVDTIYEESADSVWGFLPYVKDSDGKPTNVVDRTKLKKSLNKISNAKWKTEFEKSKGYFKLLRYVPGRPVKLDLCERHIYQGLKRKYCKVV